MILNLVFFLIFTFILAMTGILGAKILNKLSKTKINIADTNTIDFIILGLVLFTLFSRVVFFFSKANYFIFLLFFFTSLITLVKYQQEIKEYIKTKINKIISNPIDYIFFTFILLFVAYQTAKIPQHYDVDLYHTNLIRWIESYKIAPGLANLHSRFGFINNWHFLSAVTSFTNVFSTVTLHAMNGWVTWLFTTFLLGGIFKSIKTNKASNAINFVRIILLAFIFLSGEIKDNISSPTTDIPITIFTWLIFLFLLEPLTKNQHLRKLNLILFPIFLITIKFSAIPIILVTLSQLFLRENTKGIKIFAGLLATLIISTTFLTNIIVSGYLAYPFPYLSIKNLEWTLPRESAVNESAWIRSWAIHPSSNINFILNKNFFEKTTLWLIKLNSLNVSILILIYLLSLISIKKIIIQGKKISILENKIQVLIISFLGSCFWAIMAPDFRFGYGFIVFFLISLILLCFDFNEKNTPINSYTFLAIKQVTILFFTASFISSVITNHRFLKEINKKLVIPQNYNTCQVQKKKINNLDFYVPYYDEKINNKTCWNGFPGTPVIIEGFYTLGDKYTDGFAIKK